MKREDVKKIIPAITDEELSAIMGLHGSSVQGYKETVASLEENLQNLENAVKERDGKISALEETDFEKLKNEEYERAYADAKKEFEQYKMDKALDEFLKNSGARNIKAVKSLISMDEVGFEDDALTGLEDQLEKIMVENPYLFEGSGSEKPSFTSQFEGGDSIITKDAFQKLSYRERLKLYNDNPELYKEMNS